MEAITHTLQNASNAVWNEIHYLQTGAGQQTSEQTEQRAHGEEPLSGIQGKGTATDPYDAGNRDEQPGAPTGKENTAVVTEPLESITPALSQSHPVVRGLGQEDISAKTPTTTDLGPGNAVVDQPGPEKRATNPTAAIPAGGSLRREETQGDIAKAEPSDNKDTGPKEKDFGGLAAKAEPFDDNKDVGPRGESLDDLSKEAEPLNNKDVGTTTTATGTSVNQVQPSLAPARSASNVQSEQRNQPASMPSQKGSASGESSAASVSTGHRQKASEEALKGPQCPPPREPYEFEKKLDERLRKKGSDQGAPGEADEPSPPKIEGHHEYHMKESTEPHHKTMKERLGKFARVGHHLHHSER